MRTFALIAVVMAHADYLHTDSQFLNRLISSFSDCGVAVFFFASGAYWRWRSLDLTLKHATKLLPPWIMLGSLVYAVGAVKSGFSLISWLCWLVGKNTYLWYYPNRFFNSENREEKIFSCMCPDYCCI